MTDEHKIEIVTKDEITGEERVIEMYKYGAEKYANYNFETGEFETNIEGFTKEDYLEILGLSLISDVENKNE
jgi:hypothetical protein